MAEKKKAAPWQDEAAAPAQIEPKTEVEAPSMDAEIDDPLNMLEARIKELESQLERAAQGNVTVAGGTVIDFARDEIVIPTPQGSAQYVFAGECSEAGCAARTFRCASHPVRADDTLGYHLAILTPNYGDPERPGAWCQRHDPTREQKAMGYTAPVGQRVVMNGEDWRPLTERSR